MIGRHHEPASTGVADAAAYYESARRVGESLRQLVSALAPA